MLKLCVVVTISQVLNIYNFLMLEFMCCRNNISNAQHLRALPQVPVRLVRILMKLAQCYASSISCSGWVDRRPHAFLSSPLKQMLIPGKGGDTFGIIPA